MLRGPALYHLHYDPRRTEIDVAHRFIADAPRHPKTQAFRLTVLKCFQRRLEERHTNPVTGRPGDVRFNEISVEDVRQFIDVGDDGQPRADRTRARYLSVIWSVFNWALDPDIALATYNPAARLKERSKGLRARPSPKRRKVWLDEDRSKTLVATVAGADGPTAFRNSFLLRLALYTGARSEELIMLRWRDVDFAGGFIMVTGKFGKIAPVDIVPALHKALLAWRSCYVEGLGRGDIDDLPLVCPVYSRIKGGALTGTGMERVTAIQWGRPIKDTRSIRKIVERAGEQIGVDLAPHDLRRSWAGILRDRGKSDEEIRKALRHDDTKTTRLYLMDKPERIEGLEDLDLG